MSEHTDPVGEPEPLATSPFWPTWGDPAPAGSFGGQPPTTPPPVPTPPPPARRSRGLAAAIVCLAVAVVLAGTVGYLLGNRRTVVALPNGANRSPSNPFGSGGPFGNLGFPFPSIGSGGSPTSTTVPPGVKSEESALVDIDTTMEGGDSGAGTGIVLSSSGIVLTNNHVIDGATNVSVSDLGNGLTYDATVLGYDVTADVAVLKLSNASSLTTATIGGSAQVGQQVYAVGNAGGAGGAPTVTSGSIVATNQSLTANDSFNGSSELLHGMLEASALVIPGDSGGALMSKGGSVLGMDTAASSASDGTSQGFAIPINTALTIAHTILAGTSTATVHVGPTALLGVVIDPQQTSTNGAIVSSVAGGSPAASAGIVQGSRVTSVGGEPVSSGASLRLVMATLTAGAKSVVTWVDPSGKSHSATVTLAVGSPQ